MGTYANPIIAGFNPDPSIVRVNEDYFLVTSSFEYFPGVPIYHSTDLIGWKLIGHALTRTSQYQMQSPEPGGGIWAPTLRYHHGVFYIATANFTRYRPQQDDRLLPRGFYVCTKNIWDDSSWSDAVYFDQIGFDQDLFWDDNGTSYLSTTIVKAIRTPNVNLKDFAIHICTIDLESGNATSDTQVIPESPTGIAEGSHMFKRGSYYYLFTAEGGTGSQHSELVFRSKESPFGPWEAAPHNPICRSEENHEVQNTGHADLVSDSQGRWWAVLLGVRPVWREGKWKSSVFGRETFLVPVDWIDDWPVFNRGDRVSLLVEGPGLYHVEQSKSWRDDFSAAKLQLGWYRKNTPVKVDWSLTARPGFLRLYGSPYNLSVPGTPTMFLRKQLHRFCTWETQLSFNPLSPLAEAGSLVWWNYFTYSSIGIRTDGKKRFIRFRDASGSFTERGLNGHSSDVVLRIVSADGYKFGFREADDGDEDFQWLGEVSSAAMTQEPPLGLAFSGMMLGIYSFSEKQPSLAPADFHYVDIS